MGRKCCICLIVSVPVIITVAALIIAFHVMTTESDLKLVFEITRNGASAISTTAKLTRDGAKHMYKSGENLREYMIHEKKLLSTGHNSDQIYVQTTN